MTTETQEYQFKAEIKQLLQILIHSLYQDREIFLRELISNASDALTRISFEMLTNQDVVTPTQELGIWIDVKEDEAGKTLIVKDSGIGMSAEELARNLGTIAQSGAREFLEKLESGAATPTEIIGQFGVGFYSVFMVADEVRVVSRSYRPEDEAAQWISDGGEKFRVESAEKADRGTEIHISLKKDAEDLVKSWKLREIIKKHSDYVRYPISVDGNQVNEQTSLWRQSPSEVEEKDRQKFYQQMTLDFEEPLATVHFRSDSPVDVRALLFIPARRERMMMSLRKEPGIKLYTNNVLIQEYCKDLLPAWLAFVDGVVDSEELPLNVSRETIQNNRLMQQLGKVVRKRVIRTIQQMSEEDAEKFERFWKEYGRIIKEGMAVDSGASSEIEPLLHFRSSKSDGKLTSLKSYIQRMPADQEAVYYVSADSLASAVNSPHLDPFKARDWEVLYFVDPIDAFLVTGWNEIEGKPLQSVDEANLELPETPEEESITSEDAITLLIGRINNVLGDRVSEVRVSKVLRDNPIRLVAPENGSGGGKMDRIQRMINQDYTIPQRVMELNKNHPIIVNLAEKLEVGKQDEMVDLVIMQLYDGALVQEGLHPNPAEMLPRIQKLLEIATL